MTVITDQLDKVFLFCFLNPSLPDRKDTDVIVFVFVLFFVVAFFVC